MAVSPSVAHVVLTTRLFYGPASTIGSPVVNYCAQHSAEWPVQHGENNDEEEMALKHPI